MNFRPFIAVVFWTLVVALLVNGTLEVEHHESHGNIDERGLACKRVFAGMTLCRNAKKRGKCKKCTSPNPMAVGETISRTKKKAYRDRLIWCVVGHDREQQNIRPSNAGALHHGP